ncbi:hypothetical protein IQ249_18695 [Lusitaniella coriacea LEGE 07157]|uniref:Uncharacterized protein n=1 Tax=Lusitaniella coriacea LEGE 07157 TaxID=945747 RepID=A0A8J7JDD1_9CYAN|nr:hypothetical protein [Lusitaniella coriacea]MBE9117930.1 hypothetical protein [Lusitaniella coriacea LEGE 07157]
MEWKPTEETREWHCATTEEDCFEMENRFKKQGLRIRLVATPRTSDPILRIACIFDGADANPMAERFKSYQDRDLESDE